MEPLLGFALVVVLIVTVEVAEELVWVDGGLAMPGSVGLLVGAAAAATAAAEVLLAEGRGRVGRDTGASKSSADFTAGAEVTAGRGGAVLLVILLEILLVVVVDEPTDSVVEIAVLVGDVVAGAGATVVRCC